MFREEERSLYFYIEIIYSYSNKFYTILYLLYATVSNCL